jgi:hypothetical protein
VKDSQHRMKVMREAINDREVHTAVSDGRPAALEQGRQQREAGSHEHCAAIAWYAQRS